MSDERLRQLERTYQQSGDPRDRLHWQRERDRVGRLDHYDVLAPLRAIDYVRIDVVGLRVFLDLPTLPPWVKVKTYTALEFYLCQNRLLDAARERGDGNGEPSRKAGGPYRLASKFTVGDMGAGSAGIYTISNDRQC